MKKHRNLLFKPALITVLILFTLTSCGKDDKKKAEEAELDAVSASLSGTLTSYTGSQLSLKTEEGETLTFDNCSNAKLELANGIVPGNEVLLVYVGAIKDTDTSNVKVRKIIVEDNNSGLIPDKEDGVISGSTASGSTYSPAGEDEPASGVEVEKTSGTGTIIGGVNVRSDAKSGSEILGHLSAGDSVTVTGICENGWYRIVFEGGTAFIWKDYVEYER
ncbi:MAG: SH3 domain-containing protein [Blautia sp.]|nr:SH3 domain-containing protein [uncultured Blautia sp.]